MYAAAVAVLRHWLVAAALLSAATAIAQSVQETFSSLSVAPQAGPPPLLASVPPAATGTAPITAADVQGGLLCQTGAPPVPLVELTIGAAHAAMLAGRLNCTSLVGAYLRRIQAFDRRLRLKAIRAIHPNVTQRAAELDVELQAVLRNNGTALRPLFCVPLLIKDNFDVQGCATTAGNVGLLDNYPPADAHVVALMQQQGALVLAKTAMGEFAFFPGWCLSSVSGEVRNPYHLAHTPAGSSGGSAAAAAASFGMAALGSDTGNSVRGPASHTALVGLRPSLGLTSRAGLVPLRNDRDTGGPMARTVEDAVRLLEAMVGPDPTDPMAWLLQNVTLPPSYTRFLDPKALAGARIGIFRQISDLPGAHPEIWQLFEQALSLLRQAGAVLVDNFAIRGNSLGLPWEANRYGEGPAIGHWNVGGRWEDLWACQSPFRAGVDAYLAAGNASRRYHTLADIYRSGVYHPEVGDELLAALQATYAPEGYPTAAMRAAGLVCGCSFFWLDPCRSEFRQRLVESMDYHSVAAVVYPTWNKPPLKVGERNATDAYDGNNSPMIAPHTGSPAITVPMGYTGQGLPAGLQFLGRPFDEPAIIRLAFAYEQLSWHRRPPPLFPECRDPPGVDNASQVAG